MLEASIRERLVRYKREEEQKERKRKHATGFLNPR